MKRYINNPYSNAFRSIFYVAILHIFFIALFVVFSIPTTMKGESIETNVIKVSTIGNAVISSNAPANLFLYSCDAPQSIIITEDGRPLKIPFEKATETYAALLECHEAYILEYYWDGSPITLNVEGTFRLLHGYAERIDSSKAGGFFEISFNPVRLTQVKWFNFGLFNFSIFLIYTCVLLLWDKIQNTRKMYSSLKKR